MHLTQLPWLVPLAIFPQFLLTLQVVLVEEEEEEEEEAVMVVAEEAEVVVVEEVGVEEEEQEVHPHMTHATLTPTLTKKHGKGLHLNKNRKQEMQEHRKELEAATSVASQH